MCKLKQRICDFTFFIVTLNIHSSKMLTFQFSVFASAFSNANQRLFLAFNLQKNQIGMQWKENGNHLEIWGPILKTCENSFSRKTRLKINSVQNNVIRFSERLNPWFWVSTETETESRKITESETETESDTLF